ncbi:hypothetical protein ACFX13_001059 [Malus domestica]
MVRGSDRPESRLQRSIHSAAPSGKETTGVNTEEHSSQTCDKKTWRRLQRKKIPSSQLQVGVPQLNHQLKWDCGGGSFPPEYSATLPDVVLEGFTGKEVRNSRTSLSLMRHEVGGIKRGVESSSMDFIPSLQKKTRGPNTEADKKELHEGNMEVRDLWDHVEAVSVENESSALAECAGNLARGSGGWPSTAARSP